MTITIAAVALYKITYLTGTSETIEARGFSDVGENWIDFYGGQNSQLLRVRARDVHRIEIEKPSS